MLWSKPVNFWWFGPKSLPKKLPSPAKRVLFAGIFESFRTPAKKKRQKHTVARGFRQKVPASRVAVPGSGTIASGLRPLGTLPAPVSRQLFFAVPWNRKKVAGGTPWYGERLGKTWNFKIIDRSYHLLHRIFTLLYRTIRWQNKFYTTIPKTR